MSIESDLIREFLCRYDGIFIADESNLKILYADKLLQRYFGGELVGRTCHQALFGHDAPCPGCPGSALRQPGLCYWEMIRPGQPGAMYLVSGATLERDGRRYRLCRLHDISDYLLLVEDAVDYVAQLQEDAARAGTVDELTGLDNRNMYLRRLSEEYGHCESWGVIYFDINNMKQTNDTLGHDAGDELLRRAAAILRELADEDCHLYRVGGDEFLLVAADCDRSRAEALMARWQQLDDCLQRDNHVPACSLAAGLAWGSRPDTLEALVRQADSTMYRDKQRLHLARS